MAENIEKPELYSPLTLAYIGDSVLDLYVKRHFVMQANKAVQKYHKEVTAVVSAIHQAAFIDAYLPKLTGQEEAVFHRGRNASVHTKAKNATMAEYKKATGLEAVLGFLYLSGEKDRLEEVMDCLIHYQPE